MRPILGIHGWLDNCGVFDKLIPLLPREYSYLVFDLPGHGLSSKYPPGMVYTYYDTIVLIETIRREYNWEQVSFMGHSLGSQCGFFYASMFPGKVDLFLALDGFEPHVIEPMTVLKLSLVEFFRNEDLSNNDYSEPPAYDYEELVEKTVKGSNFSIDRDSAKHLIIRNVKKSDKYPNKYYFDFDRRLRGSYRVSRHPNDCLEFAANIKIPVLYLLAKDSYVGAMNYKKNAHIREFMVANNPEMHIRHGPGTHHFLLTDPEAYVDYISEFLRRYRPLKGKL